MDLKGIAKTTIIAILAVIIIVAAVGVYLITLPPPPPKGPALITGVIRDNRTGLPIMGATVTANGYSTSTDINGTYSLSVKFANYTISASKTGYATKTVPGIYVSEEKTYNVNITMALPPPLPLGKELTISQKADMSTLDVQAATDAPTLAILGHVYETLFIAKFDEAGRASFQPHLVETYEVLNETAWRFKLRAGIKFHDNTSLTSADVNATFVRGRQFSLPKLLLGPINAIVIVDDLTFVLNLSYPFGPLISHLAHPSALIMPSEIADKFWNVTITEVKNIIGSGPFKFTEFVKLERTVLVRNEGYWGTKATIEKIVWKPIEDDDTRAIAVETGAVDIATHIPPHVVSILREKGLKIVQMPSTRKIYIIIQTERIQDIRVRQAINYAVDKEAIVKKILEGAGSVAMAPICPAVFGYTELEPYTYNVTKAKALLAEANFTGKEISMIVPRGRYLKDREIAEAVADYLTKAGLKVKTTILEWAAYLPETIKGEFDLALLGWSTVTLDADYGLYALFHSANFPPGFNRARYNNTMVDELLYGGRISPNATERAQLYEEAQEIIWEEAPWIFLHFEDLIVAMRRGLVIEIHPIERWILTYAKVES